MARVREVNDRGLSDFELRAALLELMPPVAGPHSSAVRHPADMRRGVPWHAWSPELLVERHEVYLGMVERWHRAHPGEMRRYRANFNLYGTEVPGLTDEQLRLNKELAWDLATHGGDLFEVGEARLEHHERTGEWLPLSVWRWNDKSKLVMVERGPVREYPWSDDGE